MIYSQVVGTPDDELSRKTWDKTLKEPDNNWVWHDVTSETGDVVMAKRFGLQQKEKVRVIDDCSVDGYNKAYGMKKKTSSSRHRPIGGVPQLDLHRSRCHCGR